MKMELRTIIACYLLPIFFALCAEAIPQYHYRDMGLVGEPDPKFTTGDDTLQNIMISGEGSNSFELSDDPNTAGTKVSESDQHRNRNGYHGESYELSPRSWWNDWYYGRKDTEVSQSGKGGYAAGYGGGTAVSQLGKEGYGAGYGGESHKLSPRGFWDWWNHWYYGGHKKGGVCLHTKYDNAQKF
ncbi:hypothetical protein LSTR_LSTR005382 [Laodelphax striatellus]|uniref:Uncharacterized protein n=1 Tax=Laodelphax striatellus TaxID=195883 RepID=A0A482WQS5_LAOST|nr:hypothetical protein LSTR_LSTR005382 [Laodelphax striatellus]